MKKHIIWNVSELLASTFLVSSWYDIFLPFSSFGEIDIIWYKDWKLISFQVKTIYRDKTKCRWMMSTVTSHIRWNFRRVNKKYTRNSFEYILWVNKELNAIYMIPISEIAWRRSITFYPEWKENYKTRWDINWFEKYKVQ